MSNNLEMKIDLALWDSDHETCLINSIIQVITHFEQMDVLERDEIDRVCTYIHARYYAGDDIEFGFIPEADEIGLNS